jgi:FkbM family methyltransferase
MERLIPDAQACLGIGSGADVTTSGEHAIFKTLQNLPHSASDTLCLFDVGSNQGQFLQLTDRSLVATPRRIHCFEPSPSTFAILQKNAGQRSDVVLNNFGLGEVAGEFDLYSDEAGSGLASLSKRRLDHFGLDFSRRERVQIQTLDSYCSHHGITNIDLLKLDVEGHELEVLNGGARMFAERRIKIVTFEFGGCNIDSRTFVQDFYYFFNAHGMSSIFRILPSGDLQQIKGYHEALEQFRTTNFLVQRVDLPTPVA